MRRVVNVWTLTALAGGAFAVLGVLVSHWWNQPDDKTYRVTNYGVESPLPLDEHTAYTFANPSTPDTDWWQLLWPAVLAGVVAALLVLVVARTARRNRPTTD